MIRTLLRWTVVAVVIPLLAAAGCGRQPELGQVTGTVLLDGRPLARGTLAFETPGRRPASARIEDGRILDATTYRLGDGVPLGPQAIAVFAREEPPPPTASSPGQSQFRPDSMAGRSLIPRRYNDPGTSELSVTIEPGLNTLAIVLTSTPP